MLLEDPKKITLFNRQKVLNSNNKNFFIYRLLRLESIQYFTSSDSHYIKRCSISVPNISPVQRRLIISGLRAITEDVIERVKYLELSRIRLN